MNDSLGPPKANFLFKTLAQWFVALMGWKAEGDLQLLPKKFVAILAPHTSNWDLLYAFGTIYALGIKFNWFGKKEAFRWPIGGLFKKLGGIPIERSARQNMVEQTVAFIRSRERVVIGIAPEGTRSNVNYWKTGFYRIAHLAAVPIAFAFLDYRRKVGGIGPLMETTGAIEEDLKVIRGYYKGVTARYPDLVGDVAINPQHGRGLGEGK
jgi:1-acyl-sn-glycerol-3-phosphate acyltransferase